MPIDDLLAYFADWNGTSSPPLLFDDTGVCGRYEELRLHSVFQALYSTETMQPLAHEALLRARDGNNRSIPPQEAFARPSSPAQVIYFDRLCRLLHALNFVNLDGGESTLFLNVSGRHLASVHEGHGRTFETLLSKCGLKPTQIVLEILECGVDDLGHLQRAIAAYKERGYRVAMDDFGSRHSNFDRLWQLEPDIVKLDRSLIAQAADNGRARKILPKLIEIIHDLGALAVCEGIETRIQHTLAIDAGADLVQGFHYSRPTPRLQLSGHRSASGSSSPHNNLMTHESAVPVFAA